MTELLHFHFSLWCIGEGNGNPPQCPCLENPRTGEPGGLLSMGSHRVRHNWSDLAAVAQLKMVNENNYWVIVKDVIIFNCFCMFWSIVNFKTVFLKIFIFYLTPSGLSCGLQDLHCVMWDLLLWLVDSLIVACGLQSVSLVAPWHVGS